jgi:hypothetical protein
VCCRCMMLKCRCMRPRIKVGQICIQIEQAKKARAGMENEGKMRNQVGSCVVNETMRRLTSWARSPDQRRPFFS